MGTIIEAVRGVRDKTYRVAGSNVLGKRTTDQLGIQLALDHPAISDRMYYVMSKDYESREALLASKLFDRHSSVLELGASSGFMALHCLKNIKVAHYAMVEANPALASLIRRNFDLNNVNLSDATPLIEAAAAETDGTTQFVVHTNIWSSSIVNRGGATIKVPAYTIPTMLANLPFRPDCLISDIEGGELFIPVEHFDYFSKMVLETHPRLLRDGAERTRKLLDGLNGLGFKLLERAGDSYLLSK